MYSESGGIAPTTLEEPLAALFSELPAFQECQKLHWPHPRSCIGRMLAGFLVACVESSNVGQPPPTGMLYILIYVVRDLMGIGRTGVEPAPNSGSLSLLSLQRPLRFLVPGID